MYKRHAATLCQVRRAIAAQITDIISIHEPVPCQRPRCSSMHMLMLHMHMHMPELRAPCCSIRPAPRLGPACHHGFSSHPT